MKKLSEYLLKNGTLTKVDLSGNKHERRKLFETIFNILNETDDLEVEDVANICESLMTNSKVTELNLSNDD